MYIFARRITRNKSIMASKVGKNHYLDSFASHDIPTGIPSVVGRKSGTS